MKSTEEALEELGWRVFFSEQVSVEEALQCRPVRVMAVHRGEIDVAGAGSQYSIVPYIPYARPSDDHPTVGDWLLIDEVTLQPIRVLRRLNLFKRRASAAHSDDRDHSFRSIATTHSDRSRPVWRGCV